VPGLVTPSPPDPDPEVTRGLLAAGILVAILLAIVVAGRRPPAVQPIDAPASEFSAERAMVVLDRLVGDGVPHPLGSEANWRMRVRVNTELERLGFSPRVQETLACNDWGRCATVQNVAARLPGRERGHAILLMAHYDSVPYAPGAGDDGSGVATLLEIARILKADPVARHPVLFLLTDGEEAGLLGASGFARSHDWMAEVRAVINLEARGTSGPAQMFETGPDNAWIVRMLGRSCPRPTANSASTSVYERMPNDSDFTVFKREGKAGLNFGFIGDAVHYHTPRDSIETVDPRSLQHEGDCVLAVVRALAVAELPPPRQGDLVFFDVWSLGIVAWPESWTLSLALLTLLGIATPIGLVLRSGALRGRALLWGALSWPAMVGAGVVAGLAAGWLLTYGSGVTAPWTASPLPSTIALWAAAVGAAAWVATGLARRAGFWGLWAGAWMVPAGLAVVAAALAPGASFPVLVPSGIAALAMLGSRAALRPGARRRELAATLGALVAANFNLQSALAAQEALGLSMSAAVTAPLAILVTTLAPLFPSATPRSRRAICGLSAVVALVSIGVATRLPPYTEARPRSLNILFHQDTDSGTARWLVDTGGGPVPESVRSAGALDREIREPLPFLRTRSGFEAGPARPVPGDGVEVTILESSASGDSRRVRARLRSPRGAPELWLVLPPEAKPISVAIDGTRLPALDERVLHWTNGWHTYACLTAPPEGVEIDLVLPGQEPVEAYVMDRSYTLPPSGRALVGARPPNAVPQHRGDLWMTSRTLPL
jgi:hypothetical protein